MKAPKSSGGRRFVVLVGTLGGCAGGAWLSGALLIMAGPDGGAPDALAALISLALLVLIARLVLNAGGMRWLVAYLVAVLYGAGLVPLTIGM